MSNTVPTPITDKNGKQTTVHKKVDDSSVGVARVAGIAQPSDPYTTINPLTGRDYPAGLTHRDIENATDSFLVTAVFTATHTPTDEEGNETGDTVEIDSLGFSYNDFDEDSQEKAFNIILKFATENEDIVKEALELAGYYPDDLGGDLNYTINGHGTGFWDRELLEDNDLGKKLTEAASKMPGMDVYVGNNGKLDLN